MTQIIGTSKQSKCMYCGSTSYGIGCPYSPHRKHVHADDPKRCIYCGSTSFGVGCPYNPFGRNHIHGVEFNLMQKECIHRSFTASLFLSRLTQPIEETSAFTLGLVDKQGRKIREPQTIEEQNALSPLDIYIFKLRRLVSEDKIALLNTSIIVEALAQRRDEKFNATNYENEIRLKNRIANILNEYKNIIEDGIQQGLTTSSIENLVIETLHEINKRD